MSEIPGVQILPVGPATIHWLPPQVPLAVSEVERVLTADEQAHAATLRATPRRHEYQRARYLARRLADWSGPLPRSPDGVTTWPPGLTGSITHKDGYVGVALAPTSQWLSLGIDAEDAERMQEAFEARICTAAESRLIDVLAHTSSEPRRLWLTIIFSFKEALFKCHYPLGRTMFYFLDAEIEAFDPKSSTVKARLKLTTSPHTLQGSSATGHYSLWRAASGRQMVLTSVLLPQTTV